MSCNWTIKDLTHSGKSTSNCQVTTEILDFCYCGKSDLGLKYSSGAGLVSAAVVAKSWPHEIGAQRDFILRPPPIPLNFQFSLFRPEGNCRHQFISPKIAATSTCYPTTQWKPIRGSIQKGKKAKNTKKIINWYVKCRRKSDKTCGIQKGGKLWLKLQNAELS